MRSVPEASMCFGTLKGTSVSHLPGFCEPDTGYIRQITIVDLGIFILDMKGLFMRAN